jgi:glycerol uptake facilitator-like aquaporin
MNNTAAQKIAAEGIGSAALLTAVVGSGMMGEQLAAGNTGIALLANTLATACVLYLLISALAPISGAHLNPLVSVMAWHQRAISARLLWLLILAQCAGAVLGVWLAHAMFGQSVLQTGIKPRTGAGLWLAEAVATAGLVLTIRLFSMHRPVQVAAGVACYIAAAYWFTASTSFANPAVTLARSLTTSFAGILPAHAPAFVVSQCAGAVVGYGLARLLLGGSSRILHQPRRGQDDEPAHSVLHADVRIAK